MSDPRDPLADRDELADSSGLSDAREDDDRGADPPEPTERPRLFKLLQGYIWHPVELELELGDWLPRRVEPDVHLMWDPLERAPFTFFDDGTLASTQRLYQFTVVRFDPGEEPERIVPWLAETIQAKLEATPEGVGWQIMEDLREIE